MKVLMFGWEFPPHISGGLGTACYGLTKGLSKIEDLEILFVVPKLYGDEDDKVAQLIGAGDIYVKQTQVDYADFWNENRKYSREKEFLEVNGIYKTSDVLKNVSFIEVTSALQPYLSAEEFKKFLEYRNLENANLKIGTDGKFYYEKDGIITEIRKNTVIESTIKVEGKFNFSGTYGINLMEEVINYAKVAAVIAEQNDFDLIHAHDWLANAAGIAAKEVSGKPLVIHVHATEYDRGGEERINSQVYALEQAGMHNADRVITVSNMTRNIVINKYGTDPSKVFTVYNAAEPQEAENVVYKRNLDEKIVTFLGRITYQKGPAYFVRAAKMVLDRVDNVRFVMAGSGDMFEEMIRYAAELKIADRFHFTNFLKGDDVTKMFAISDVYVMPSISEPFGISPLEAMRSNVPVIISKQSGVAEILTNAIKLDYWDDEGIADAIHALVKYDGLAEIFKKKSKPEVDSLKWEHSAIEVKKIYDSLFV